MPRERQKRRRNNRRIWVGVVFVVLIVIAAVVTFFVVRAIAKSPNEQDSIEGDSAESTINYKKPTDGEVGAGAAIKSGEQKDGTDEDESEQQAATDDEVEIFGASQEGSEVIISARIIGIVEDNGTCEYTFMRGSKTFTKTQIAVANVKNTSCGALRVGVNEFAESGVWTVTVKYGNAKNTTTVEVTK